MGPDGDCGEGIAHMDESIHHEEHGLVLFSNQEREPAVPRDGDPLSLVVMEVCWRPFVLDDEVIEERSC